MFTFPQKQSKWGHCSGPRLYKAFGRKSTNKKRDNPVNGFCGQWTMMSYFFTFTADSSCCNDFMHKKSPCNPLQRQKEETIRIQTDYCWSVVLLATSRLQCRIFSYLQLKSHVCPSPTPFPCSRQGLQPEKNKLTIGQTEWMWWESDHNRGEWLHGKWQ